MIDLHTIEIASYHIPMLHEIGYMEDLNGEFRHPDRLMKRLHVFIFVVAGQMEVIEDGQIYTLTAGHFLFLHRGVKHWGNKFYQPGTKWYFIHFFTPDHKQLSTWNEYQTPHLQTMIPEDGYFKKLTLPKHGQVQYLSYVRQQLNQMITNQKSDAIERSVQCHNLFLQLYALAKQAQAQPRHQQIVKAIIELCHQSDHKLTSDDIVAQIHLSYPYISTIFKKETGQTIRQYQNHILIEQAIDLFNSTDFNITEVSDRLGFANPYYFSRIFKKVTGISPSQYLNQRYIRSIHRKNEN